MQEGIPPFPKAEIRTNGQVSVFEDNYLNRKIRFFKVIWEIYQDLIANEFDVGII
jgi:hypothetical protein